MSDNIHDSGEDRNEGDAGNVANDPEASAARQDAIKHFGLKPGPGVDAQWLNEPVGDDADELAFYANVQILLAATGPGDYHNTSSTQIAEIADNVNSYVAEMIDSQVLENSPEMLELFASLRDELSAPGRLGESIGLGEARNSILAAMDERLQASRIELPEVTENTVNIKVIAEQMLNWAAFDDVLGEEDAAEVAAAGRRIEQALMESSPNRDLLQREMSHYGGPNDSWSRDEEHVRDLAGLVINMREKQRELVEYAKKSEDPRGAIGLIKDIVVQQSAIAFEVAGLSPQSQIDGALSAMQLADLPEWSEQRARQAIWDGAVETARGEIGKDLANSLMGREPHSTQDVPSRIEQIDDFVKLYFGLIGPVQNR